MARNVTTNVGVNVKTNGAKRAASEVSAVGAALRKLGNNAETTTESTTKLTRTQTRLGQASASNGRQFSSQAAGLGGLVGAYAGAAATIFALQQAFSALNRAAQAETIIQGTQTLAAQIGESGNKIIASLQGITEGQLTMAEAAEKANMALASGFNTNQIERLTNVALKASRALGRNLNEAFERLVRGSAKLEPELLDELGIFTRLDPAVEAYAKQLGKAAKDLTSFERRQAFVNAVIEEGERKFSEIDTTAPSAQKSLEQLSTTISDLGTKFGILLANALVPVANFFTEDLSLAISAFALIVRQVGAVAFTQIGEAAMRAGASLNAWAATTLSTTASNQKAQNSINAMNEALTELGRTYARGNIGDVNQANAMFTQMREGTITVTQLKDAQKVLEKQINNSNSSIDQNTQELARLESQGKQNTKLYSQLTRSVTQARADLVQYDNALIAVTAAQETQTKTTLAGARALTIFNTVARATAATLGFLMRAFNIFLLLASFGPIILKLVGQVDILNGIVENVTKAFNDYKLSIDSVRTGVATIANDANIDKITEKFKTLGLSAEQAAKNQQDAIEAVNKIAIDAAAPGLIESTLNILPGFGTALKEALYGVPTQDNTNLQILEELDTKIQELQSTLASSSLNPAEALNLRQTLTSLEAMRDSFGDTNFRVREFAGILASLTGLQASSVLDTLTESSDQLAISLDGVVVATRDNLGQAFKIANQNATELITQFVGFSSVISNANKAISTIGTPSKELIAIGEQLTNSQANLNNVIDETRARVADYYDVIRQEDAAARAAFERGDREAGIAAVRRSALATLERDRLLETLNGVTTVTRRENERLEELKNITNELAKQETLYDNILKKFSSQISSFKDLNLADEFSFGAEGIKIAANEFERANNQLEALRNRVSEYGATTDAEFADLGARLQAELGDRITLATGEIVNGFDASKESVVQFIQRIEGAKIANQQLAGEVAQVLQNEQLLRTEAEIVLGTFIQQLPALRALVLESEKFARQQQVNQLATLGENRISVLQQELKSTQNTVQLRREESDLQRRLIQARLSTINAQRQGSIEQLRAQDQLLNSQKEQLQIQQEIAELKITAAQNEKEAAKSLLEIGKSGIESSSLFGDSFKEIVGVIADLGAMNLDIGIAEDELTKKQLKIENLDQLADIEQQSVENRRKIAAIEHEQRMAALEQELVNIEYQFEKDMEVLADRAAQIDTERQILEIRKTIADAQTALEQENLKTEIELMRARVEEANRLVLGMQTFINDYSTQNTTFISDLDFTQQKLIEALNAAAATIAGAAGRGGAAPANQPGSAGGVRYNNGQSFSPVGYGAGSVDPRLAAAVNRGPVAVRVSNTSDISEGLAEWIKGSEGFSSTAYWDQKQYSIGFGTQASGPDEVISREEGLARFSAELSRFTGAVDNISNKYGYNWNESQKAALTSFAYNLGEGTLETLTAQGTRTNQQIADAMLAYTNVASDDQRIEAALANRRREEQEVFLSGLNSFTDRLQEVPATTGAAGLDLGKSLNDLNTLAEGVDGYYTTIREGSDAVYTSQLEVLAAQEASLEKQGNLRTDINKEEAAGARAALEAARAAGAASDAYWDQEAQNANSRAKRDKLSALEEERQAERQLKLLKLREAQATFQGLSKFGGFLESVTTVKAKDALTKAEEEYNTAMEKRSVELEKLKGIRDKENDVLTRSMELMTKRREIEQKYIETVGLGIEGADAYYSLQKEYLDNINQAASQSADYETLARERTIQSIQLSLAEMEVVKADMARTEAEAKLNNGIIKTIGSIGGFIRKLGEFGNALISIGSLVSGLTAASGQGGIFGNILKGFGLDLGALKNLPMMIASAIAIPFQLNAGKNAEAVTKSAEAASSVTSTVKGLSGLAQTISTGFSIGIASVGIAQKIGILGDQPTTANYVGGALGGILGSYVGGLVAGAIAGSSFGAALGFALGPIGALLGGLLGSWLGDLFASTKTSVGGVNLQSGALYSSGEKGAELAPLAKSAKTINDLVEDIIGAGTRASDFQAVFSRKGSKVKAKELQITVAGETFTKEISDDSEQLGKDMFELIMKGFTTVGNADVRRAISRLDFDRAIEDNLKDIQFAAGFRGVINNLTSRMTGSFITIAEEVEIIAATAAQNLDQLTGGLMRNFRDLRTEAERVFGETSSQVKELDSAVQGALLNIAGITVSASGVVKLIERQSTSLNNMALIFAQTEGEMLGFKDALVETGMSAAEADRILRQAADLKMLKIAEDFYQAVNRATEVAKGIDPSVYENIEKILTYQNDIVRDAKTIQDKFPGKFSDAVAKAEELAQIQRLRLVAEGSDEQLKAIRLLTSVTGDFADAVVQAAVQAEIASRTLLAAFNTSEIQKAARRSEARLSFNYASVGLATGGMVSGSGAQQNKDSVPAMLMPGEFVLNKESSEKIGYDTLFALNSGNFVQMAAGGRVQTGLTGGTTATPSSTRSGFAAYESDANDSFISFAEAANILTDANEDLYNSYLNVFKSINSNLVPALNEVKKELLEGDILQARAIFEYTTNVRAAVSVTDALNQIVAESRTQESLRVAGLIASIDEIDNFVKASDAFYLAVQQPQDYLVQSQGLYKKLYTATNELNKLLAQGTISTDEYNSAIDSLNNAYNDSIELVREYNDFFIELNDSLDNTGALSAVRSTVDMYVTSLDKIKYAVEDGVISVSDSGIKTIELNKLYNQKRLELVQNSSEEQLKVLRDAATNAENYAGGVATIVDFTYQAGAAMELVSRQLQAASESFSKFEISLVDFYNSTLQTSTGFGSRLTKSVESIFLEAGVKFDDALGTFYGSVGNFAVAAQQGLIGLGNLEQAINELNYQLVQSEDIDIETYQTGIAILQGSFMDFITTFQDMRNAFDTTKDSMESFRSSLLDSFNSIQEDVTSIVEGMVSNYRSNFENLKGLFDSAVSQQATAEEELYNTLFDAQKAFASAGGNLSSHVDRINDIVSGLDPQYTGYAGLDQYLVDLKQDIIAGTAAIGNIDTRIPLATLQQNLQTELASLSALKVLPDSADKFVKISRALSRITDLESQIASSTSAVDNLKDAALQLVGVEKELNLNNTTAGLTGVDLTLTEIQEDLLQRAIDARAAYNDANAVLDGYNTALATNTVYTQGLADIVPSVADNIANFTSRLADVSSEFLNVQTAISAVSAAGLTASLNNIVFDTDAYNIDVQPFSDSSKVLTELTAAISEYQNIVNAKVAYEALYGALDITATTLPIDEFNELNAELVSLESKLLAVAKNMDPTITSLATLDSVFKTFVTDAIALLETPIQLDINEPRNTSSLATYTVATSNDPANAVGFGTSATNALLQAILTQGLGVRSPGYLYYSNLYLEDIRSILSEMLIVSGGVVPALNNIAAPIASAATSTSTGNTVYAGPNLDNLSGLTGQLFSVTEPIAMPADYFYIIVPQVIKLQDIIEVIENEIALHDLITIVKAESSIDMWMSVAKRATSFEEWFDITTLDRTIEDFFNIIKLDKSFDDFINIIKQDMDYRMWFHQPTPMPTNYLKWFIPTQEETSWGAWFAPPTLTQTGFADWFSWPPTTKWDTDAYDWFTLEPKDIRYIDFFNVSQTLDINEFLTPTAISGSDLYNINTTATTFEEWFYIVPLAALTYYDFFDGISKGQTAFADWFTVADPQFIQPNDLYVVDQAISLSARAFYNLTADNISGSEVYTLAAPLSVAADDLVKINDMTRIPVYYTDVFDPQTVRLHLTDMFDNYTVNGGFLFTKATVDSSQLFDIQRFNEYGFATKLVLKASDIFAGVNQDGIWSLSDREKIKVTANTFFEFEPLEDPFEKFFTTDKVPTNFYQWFEVPGKINISNVFEVFDPIPLDLRNVFNLTNTREALAPSQVFTISPNPTVVQASQVFDIGAKYVVNGNEVFTFQPYKILASEVIDFSYIKENPYILVAKDVLDVVNKLQLDFNNYIDIVSKATYNATDLILVNKSTFYGKDLLNIIATDYFSEDVFTISNPTVLPGSSFYSLSGPAALPASSFIGVDPNRKIQYQFNEVFEPLKNQLNLGSIFENYNPANGFTWVKYTLAVEDVINLSVLTTAGLRDKVTLSVADLVANFNNGVFALTNKGNIDYNALFNPIVKLNSNYFSWFLPVTKLNTTFQDWFYMGDASKLDLNMLVNNTVPLDYRNVFNFSFATPIKPTKWDDAINFDAATKIAVRANDALLIQASVYDASQFIQFNQWKLTVSDLLDASYVRANPVPFKAAELFYISETKRTAASELISITEKIDVDVNSLVNPVASSIAGNTLFSPTVSNAAGNTFFRPTQSALAGSAFFTPISTSINANDLFIISEKVPIDVTATFKSDFMAMVNAITAFQAAAIPYFQRIDDNIKTQPVDSAVAFYNQIWQYYQNTFLTGYYDQWTPRFAKLADIALSVATTTSVVQEVRDTMNLLWNWTKNIYELKVNEIITLLTNANNKADTSNNWLSALETTGNAIETLVTSGNGKLDTSNNWLSALETTANAIETLITTGNSKLDTANSLLVQVRDRSPEGNVFTEMKGLLASIELTLFNIRTGTDYIDDVEKVLRESIFLNGISKLVGINKYRYVYAGATGQNIPGFKTGGLVEGPGSGTSDSITAKLSNGEFVLTANTVSKLGTDFLSVLNNTGSISDAVSSLGIRGDTQVAHINDAEASLLKSIGGSGSENTRTGLKQYFFDDYSPTLGASSQAISNLAAIIAATSQTEAYSPERINSNAKWDTANFAPNTFAKKALVYATQYIAATRNNKIFSPQEAANAIGALWYEFDAPNRVQFNSGSSFNNSTPNLNDYNKIIERLKLIYPSFADGGLISGPGTGTSDSIMAMLSDREYIIRNSSVDNVGVPTLDYINRNGELPRGDTTVEINITNNGQPVDVEGDPQVRFDGEKIVVDVVLKDLRTNGPIKRTLKKLK